MLSFLVRLAVILSYLVNIALSSYKAEFSYQFQAGITNGACQEWDEFRMNLFETYSSFTVSGTYDQTGRSCSDATVVNSVAEALRLGHQYSGTCGADTWTVNVNVVCGQNCGTFIGASVELTNKESCVCDTFAYTVRPANPTYWGGVNSSTCDELNGAPMRDQTIKVTFVMATSPVSYSDSFAKDQTPTTQCTSWNNFTNQLVSTNYYLDFTAGGAVCTDRAVATDIAKAMHFGYPLTRTCNGNTWSVGIGCGNGCDGVTSPIELTTNAVCTCSGSGVTIRPGRTPTVDWGGVGQSCNAASQTLAVSFTYTIAVVTESPTQVPSNLPTTQVPSNLPSLLPSSAPTAPTRAPTFAPTSAPTNATVAEPPVLTPAVVAAVAVVTTAAAVGGAVAVGVAVININVAAAASAAAAAVAAAAAAAAFGAFRKRRTKDNLARQQLYAHLVSDSCTLLDQNVKKTLRPEDIQALVGDQMFAYTVLESLKAAENAEIEVEKRSKSSAALLKDKKGSSASLPKSNTMQPGSDETTDEGRHSDDFDFVKSRQESTYGRMDEHVVDMAKLSFGKGATSFDLLMSAVDDAMPQLSKAKMRERAPNKNKKARRSKSGGEKGKAETVVDVSPEPEEAPAAPRQVPADWWKPEWGLGAKARLPDIVLAKKVAEVAAEPLAKKDMKVLEESEVASTKSRRVRQEIFVQLRHKDGSLLSAAARKALTPAHIDEFLRVIDNANIREEDVLASLVSLQAKSKAAKDQNGKIVPEFTIESAWEQPVNLSLADLLNVVEFDLREVNSASGVSKKLRMEPVDSELVVEWWPVEWKISSKLRLPSQEQSDNLSKFINEENRKRLLAEPEI